MTAARHAVADQFHVDDLVAGEERPRYNISPSQPVLAVATAGDGARRRLGTLHWGLVPRWAKDPSVAGRLINARVETAGSKPAFREAVERRRCLIPASGFYEWEDAGRPRTRGSRKVPHYFRRSDGLLLAIGGLWDVWRSPDGQMLRTCVILTTDANRLAGEVHHRMPVLVPEDLWDVWLSRRPLSHHEWEAATAPAPEDLLTAVRVSERVNDAAAEGAELIEPNSEDGQSERPDGNVPLTGWPTASGRAKGSSGR